MIRRRGGETVLSLCSRMKLGLHGDTVGTPHDFHVPVVSQVYCVQMYVPRIDLRENLLSYLVLSVYAIE